MTPRFIHPRLSKPRIQRGLAVILLVVLIAIGIGAALITMTGSGSLSRSQQQAQQDYAVLAEVKAALVGWSTARDPAAHGVNARPGELPCPDINPLDGYEDGSCVAGAIGRVPWKTLGIAEPKDAAGETLWYAISGPFRIYNMSSAPITSDTLGTLTVHQDSTATTITNQAIAVLFAPGAALGNQDRSAGSTMACTAPSGTYARNQCASNYLEARAGVNNATINGPFIHAQQSDAFNDRVLAITNADLMPAVEARVAREMMALLESYRRAATVEETYGYYPAADISDGKSNDKYNRHRFPCDNEARPRKWSEFGITLPNWLTNGCDCRTSPRGWNCVVFYAVSRYRLRNNDCITCASSTILCPGTTTSSDLNRLTVTNPQNRAADICTPSDTPGASLSTCATAVPVSGTGNADLVLITPGAATADRWAGWPDSTPFTPITGYFDDSSNAANDDFSCFVVPTSTKNDRDRIYIVPKWP